MSQNETSGLTSTVFLRGPVHGLIQTIRGMCSDECSHVEIDAKLRELDDRLYVLIEWLEAN